jgi:hypothetical protein
MKHHVNKPIVGNRIRQIRKALNLKGKDFLSIFLLRGTSGASFFPIEALCCHPCIFPGYTPVHP